MQSPWDSAEVWGEKFDYDFQKPCDDPANLRVQQSGLSRFGYRHRSVRDNARKRPYATYYKAITGPGTAFDPREGHSLRDLPPDVVLIVRVEESRTHWMQPGDLDVNRLTVDRGAKRLLCRENGYAVLFADGGIAVLSNKLPFCALCKFSTVASAKRYDRDKVLGPYCLFRFPEVHR